MQSNSELSWGHLWEFSGFFFPLFLVFELVLATGSSGTRKKSKLNTVQFRSSSKGDRKGCEDENLYSFFHKIHSFLQFL